MTETPQLKPGKLYKIRTLTQDDVPYAYAHQPFEKWTWTSVAMKEGGAPELGERIGKDEIFIYIKTVLETGAGVKAPLHQTPLFLDRRGKIVCFYYGVSTDAFEEVKQNDQRTRE